MFVGTRCPPSNTSLAEANVSPAAVAAPNDARATRTRMPARDAVVERAALGQPPSNKGRHCTRGVAGPPQPPATAYDGSCMDAARALLETAMATRNLMLTSRKVHKES